MKNMTDNKPRNELSERDSVTKQQAEEQWAREQLSRLERVICGKPVHTDEADGEEI